MSEYSKKTVADLQEILKTRSLPTTGKKADLIARLTEADKAAEDAGSTEPTPAVEAATEPEPELQDIQNVETDANGSDAVQTDPQTVDAAADSEPAPPVEEKNFALNLAASDIDSELARRKARAERFKTGNQADADADAAKTADADTDALKALERAKKFGGDTNAIGKLDEALPSERQRGQRSNRRGGGTIEGTGASEDSSLKRNFNNKGRFNGRRRGGPGKPTGIAKPSSGHSNDRDRQAADARKQRFAQA